MLHRSATQGWRQPFRPGRPHELGDEPNLTGEWYEMVGLFAAHLISQLAAVLSTVGALVGGLL